MKTLRNNEYLQNRFSHAKEKENQNTCKQKPVSMNIIENISALVGPEILQKSGATFYSHFSTIKKGKYLIVGMNPGGIPDENSGTIKQSLEDIQQDGYNAYFQEWLPNGREHRLQKNLKWLFSALGEDLRNICATNLIYERSRKEKEVSLEQLPIYREILSLTLKVVDPEVIVTFGQKPFEEIKTHLKATDDQINLLPSGHGSWTIQLLHANSSDKNIKVIGFPHLSIYTLYNREPIFEKVKLFTAKA